MSKQLKFDNEIFESQETYSRDDIRSLQLANLKKCVARVQSVPFYKKKFQEMKISPESIKTLDDLRRLPFTTKADLRAHYPIGFLACPHKDVVRYHASTGTTGEPTFVAYTAADLDLWSRLCARFLVAGGLRSHHVVQIAFGYGLFTGGFGLHQGVERVGAAIIPTASGNTMRQIKIMIDMKTDVLVCTPSYALNIGDVLLAQNIKPDRIALKYAHFGAEAWTEPMRDTIESIFGIEAYNNYGLSEVMGPGVSGECYLKNGMHLQEDAFIVELIDPDTLEPVPEGMPGELVLTSVTREAFPVIRYRTRDIAVLDYSPCPCGRTTHRMSRIMGRSDDMLIIRGVNFYPTQVEEAILNVEGIAPHYHILVRRPNKLDELTVQVEILPSHFSDRFADLSILKQRVAQSVMAVANLHVNIDLLPPGSIARSEGKANRITDQRELF